MNCLTSLRESNKKFNLAHQELKISGDLKKVENYKQKFKALSDLKNLCQSADLVMSVAMAVLFMIVAPFSIMFGLTLLVASVATLIIAGTCTISIFTLRHLETQVNQTIANHRNARRLFFQENNPA